MNLPRSVLIIAFAVTITSAAFSFWLQDRPRVDAKAYDTIGWNIARGLGYVENETLVLEPEKDDSIVRVGPGYEYFLSGVYYLFGHKHWAVWILHALFLGISVILIYLLAYSLFRSSSVALLSAFLFGFSPDLVVINAMLLTETVFIMLLIMAVWASVIYFQRKNTYMALLTGSLWALAVLTRPVAILPLAVVLGVMLWQYNWKHAAAALIIPVILVGSWSLYVSDRYDSFILTTTAGWYDMWVGNHAGATGGFDKSPEIQDVRNTHHSVEVAAIARKKYFEFVREHPFAFAELQFRKLSIYFNITRPGGFWIGLWAHKIPLLTIVASSFIWNIILFGAGLSGAWLVYKRRGDLISRIFLAVAFMMPLGVIPIIVETRYRYPFFPFLAIFAAYFLTQKPFAKKTLFVVVLILAVFGLYDLLYNWAGFMDRLDMILIS